MLRARRLMSLYEDMAELVRLGAYRAGADAELDEAIRLQPAFERFLAQDRGDPATLEQGYAELEAVLAGGAAR